MQLAVREGLPCSEGSGLCAPPSPEAQCLSPEDAPVPCDSFEVELLCVEGEGVWLQRQACEGIALGIWSTQIFNGACIYMRLCACICSGAGVPLCCTAP